jgi:methylenetetrahydrofolate dehydrogenase (NADP+)/methenyltetrahydrofolate cyclohydrolase
MATIISGVKTAQEIKNEIAGKVRLIHEKDGKTPHLAAVLVGDDGASQAYVGGKVKACEFVGFKSTLKTFDADISEEKLLKAVDQLNADPDIDGYIVQLPLPAHISAKNVTERILPEKDVDGFHPVNVGRMVKNLPAYISATPFGIMQLLERYGIET